MESVFKFQDGMDIDPNDFIMLETFAQQGLDHVVGDAIAFTSRYAGFNLTKNGTTTVGIDVGRLYSGGLRYASNTAQIQDFLPTLPAAGNKIVLVCVNGSTQDSNVTPREFLIDETTGASQPRAVAIETDRIAVLSFAYGNQSPTPVAPIVSSAFTVIGSVLLSTAGVVSVTMNPAAALANLDNVAARTAALELWESEIGPQISTLASDIARLSNQASANSASPILIGQMLERIATLEAKDGISASAQSSAADFFLDTTTSDTTNPLYLAMVEEGIRYAYAAQNEIPIALFNPTDPQATISNGIIFPTFVRSPRQTVGPIIADVQISAYTYNTSTMVQKEMSRSRIRYGTSFTVCTNSAFWQSGSYDPATSIFTLPNGETFNVAFTGTSYDGTTAHEYLRLTGFWTDTYQDPYWTAVTTTNTVNGAQVAESFLAGQDYWLESVELTFTSIDTSGPVTVVVCEAGDTGTPDLTQVIAQATLTQAQLIISPTTTVFAWTPAYLQAGNRYAIVVITAGNHKIGTAAGTSFTQGTFFTLTGGGFASGDLTRHIAFTLNSCKFSNPSTTLTLQPLQLSGGITDIDVLFGTINPASTVLTFQVQVAGAWIPLSSATAGAINAGGNLPALLPLQVTMLGTPDIMPAINSLQSNITMSRPRTSLNHISTVRTPPTPTQHITVIERYEAWNYTYHTAAVTLMTGGSFATVVAATSFTDAVIDSETIERTYTFTLGATITAYKIQSALTTQTALIVQQVAWRKDYCL